VLTPRLEIRESRWYPDEADGLGLEILSFAEAGRPAQNPGPLIRARAGTIIRLSVPGTLADSTVVLYGLPTHSGSFVRETALGPMLGCDGYG
jgi:hypothetical protein